MTPERFKYISKVHQEWAEYVGCHSTITIAGMAGELLDHVVELNRQLESARALAVASGIFQDHRGEDYAFDSEHEYTWRADDVGPVAWDKQVEQL